MDPKSTMSAYAGHTRIVAPCSLFIPTVKDSRVCGVCRFAAHEHFMNAQGLLPNAPVKKVSVLSFILGNFRSIAGEVFTEISVLLLTTVFRFFPIIERTLSPLHPKDFQQKTNFTCVPQKYSICVQC